MRTIEEETKTKFHNVILNNIKDAYNAIYQLDFNDDSLLSLDWYQFIINNISVEWDDQPQSIAPLSDKVTITSEYNPNSTGNQRNHTIHKVHSASLGATYSTYDETAALAIVQFCFDMQGS